MYGLNGIYIGTAIFIFALNGIIPIKLNLLCLSFPLEHVQW